VIGQAEQRIGTAYSMPAKCQAWLLVTERENAAGPQLTVLATLRLSALQLKVVYRIARGSGNELAGEISFAMPLVPEGERVVRPPTITRGPRGDSSMSLQLFDFERSTLSEERGIGACADGLCQLTVPFLARVSLVAWLGPKSLGGHPPGHLRLDGELTFVAGVFARLRIRPAQVGVATTGGLTLDVPLAHPGTTLHLAERLIERDLPGSHSLGLVFVDGEGRPLGRERCFEPTRTAP
jgi:hypothetical protein